MQKKLAKKYTIHWKLYRFQILSPVSSILVPIWRPYTTPKGPSALLGVVATGVRNLVKTLIINNLP
jgi:hypothetical protein